MALSQNGKNRVSREELKQASESNKVYDFMGNYNQMKNFGIKNHAKVFEESKDNMVTLWAPISGFVKGLFDKG